MHAWFARRGRDAVVTALAVLTPGLAACTSPGPASPAASASHAPGASAPAVTTLQQVYVSVIRRVLPSVVEIRAGSSVGSGVVFDSAGDVVTNAHVVGKASRFQVLLPNAAAPRPAVLVGSYLPDDLAVIKVSGAKGLRPASFGNSAKLQVGEFVLAIGSPLGLSGSVTDGIVSAVGRDVSEPAQGGSPGAVLPDMIQTSAAINPGNSGGALVDLRGQVVGIPTLGLASKQAGAAITGIGFAISSNTATDIVSQLVKYGHVTDSHRAALGVEVTTVAGHGGTPAGVGVVSVTKGGPAARAGIRAGDVITAVNGIATPDTQTLSSVLAALHPGQVVPVAVSHAGGTKATVRVTLGQLPGT